MNLFAFVVIGIVGFFLVIATVLFVMYKMNNKNDFTTPAPQVQDTFQGPVPPGYDEEHFRQTGETIKLTT